MASARLFGLASGVLAVSFAASPAHATPITFTFAGLGSAIGAGSLNCSPPYSPGDVCGSSLSWTSGALTVTATTQDGKATAKLPTCTGESTTTTGPVVIDLPIGGSFTTPDPGPYPEGAYTASSPDCAISYQVYKNGKWKDEHSSGDTLVLDGPGRNFVADPGTSDCTYTRFS